MQSSLDTLEANLAVRYLNAQLVVNHQSAQSRHESYKDLGINLTEERRNAYAWAMYSARQKGRNPAVFHLSFDKPTISFVCDHDALLELNLLSAVLSIDGQQSPSNVPPAFQQVKIIFRITTERRTIVGNDAKVGDHESRIHLLVFDFEHARLVEIVGTTAEDRDRAREADLERHLTGYLRSLQTGGHHVLFFPPEFDEDDLRSPIRFSLTSDTLTPLNDIHGFTATMMNGYLSLVWYTCAFIAREQQDKMSLWTEETSLAGYTSWTVPGYRSEWHSSIKFSQPEVSILCAREVILYFTLSEVTFFTQDEVDAEDFNEFFGTRTAHYSGWRIALILNVVTSPIGVMIEASSARFGAQFSRFDPAPSPDHEAAFDTLIAFFIDRYLKLVARTKLQYLFQRFRDENLRIVGTAQEADGSWWMLERDARFGANALDSTIRHTKMHGFDIVIAISQTSINTQLRSRLSRIHDLARWESDTLLLEVKSISVRLLGERAAVVTISISEGTLRSLLGDDFNLQASDTYRFGDCRVAFVVDILECSHEELANPDYSPRPYEYPPESDKHEYTLRHIFLNLAHARHAPERTYFDDADFDGIDNRVPMTLIYLIQTEYFAAILQQGMHVIASIPVYSHTAAARFYRLTRMTFRTFSVEINEAKAADADQQASRSEQIIFILGMTGKTTIPRVESFKPSTRWVVHASAGFSHGTFAISRATFISRLYALLARVNALTTLVPVSPSYDMGADVGGVVLQWAKHPDFREQPCEWKAVDSDDTLTADRFEWRYARDWRLQEEGTTLPVKGEYLISCTTHNELELPDITMLSNGSLEVRMSGQIRLRIASARNENTWSTESSAFWKVSIAIKTAGRGIVKVEIDGIDNVKQTPPKTTIRRGNGDVPDAYAILQKHLPQEEDFNEILEELKELEGAWKYYYPSASAFTLCSPTFNFDGDLLFELRRSQINQQYFVNSDSRPSDVRNGKGLGSSLSSTRSSSPTGGIRVPPGPGPRPSSPSGGYNIPDSPDGGARRTRSPGPVRGRGGGPPSRPSSPGPRPGSSRPASPRPSPGAQRSPGGTNFPGQPAAPAPQRGAVPNLGDGANRRDSSRGPASTNGDAPQAQLNPSPTSEGGRDGVQFSRGPQRGRRQFGLVG